MPLISVVIPTVNRPELVCRALRTVVAQTIRDIEIIVVVDGHDVLTCRAIDLLDDERIRIISHATSRGPGPARNSGVAEARAPWIAFLDDDDEWMVDKLQCQLAAAEDDFSIITTLSRVVGTHATFIRPSEPYQEDVAVDEWLFDRRTWTKGGMSFLQTSSLMIPRKLFDQLQFNEIDQHEEWELVIRAVKSYKYRLRTVERVLTVYHVPENRKSLSNVTSWRTSLNWAANMKDVLTPVAYSGFCLTVIAQMAAASSNRIAFMSLLSHAIRHGSPTLKQLFAFMYFFLSPKVIRQHLRSTMQAE